MPTLDDITAAVKAMRAKFDPSQLTAAAGDQTLGNWQYNDTLNGLMKNSMGMDVQSEQQAQLAKNNLASQITDLSRQYKTDRGAMTNDFADRGMLYSGGHIGKQADLGGQFVANTGQAEQGTTDFLSGLKQKLADAQVATEEQKRQADMQKLQTDQAYAMAQAQTDSYTNALNAANNPAPAPQIAATPVAPVTAPAAVAGNSADGGNVPGTHSQGWGQAPSGQWQQALQRYQQRQQAAHAPISPMSQGTSPSPQMPATPMPGGGSPMAQPQPAMSPPAVRASSGVPSPMPLPASPTPQQQFMQQPANNDAYKPPSQMNFAAQPAAPPVGMRQAPPQMGGQDTGMQFNPQMMDQTKLMQMQQPQVSNPQMGMSAQDMPAPQLQFASQPQNMGMSAQDGSSPQMGMGMQNSGMTMNGANQSMMMSGAPQQQGMQMIDPGMLQALQRRLSMSQPQQFGMQG